MNLKATLIATLTLFAGGRAWSAPNGLLTNFPCAQPVSLSGPSGSNPWVTSDSNSSIVYFDEAYSGSSAHQLRFVDFGADGLPGTADDRTGSLGFPGISDSDSSPRSDGETVTFLRYSSSVLPPTASVITIGLGPDRLPGTSDDTQESVVWSAPLSVLTLVTLSIQEGLVTWTYSNPTSTNPNLIGFCDLYKPMGVNGSCAGSPIVVTLPTGVSTVGRVQAVRNYALGVELQLLFAQLTSFTFGNFSQQTAALELNYGAVVPWGPINRNVVGVLFDRLPVTARGSGPSAAYEYFEPLAPFTPLEELKSPAANVGLVAVANHGPGLSALPYTLWVGESTMDLLQLQTDLHYHLDVPLVSGIAGAVRNTARHSIDGEIVAYEHTEDLPGMSASTNFGVYTTVCR